jgi:hypothetical protein
MGWPFTSAEDETRESSNARGGTMSHRACQRFIEFFFFMTVCAIPTNLLDVQASPKNQHFPMRACSRICRGLVLFEEIGTVAAI